MFTTDSGEDILITRFDEVENDGGNWVLAFLLVMPLKLYYYNGASGKEGQKSTVLVKTLSGERG